MEMTMVNSGLKGLMLETVHIRFQQQKGELNKKG